MAKNMHFFREETVALAKQQDIRFDTQLPRIYNDVFSIDKYASLNIQNLELHVGHYETDTT